jgi:hypothetical protein
MTNEPERISAPLDADSDEVATVAPYTTSNLVNAADTQAEPVEATLVGIPTAL